MKRFAPLLAIALIAGACSAAPRPADPPYAVQDIIAGPDGGYDYISIDPRTGRVFVGRDFGVMMFDPATGKTATLLARNGVAAVLPIAGTRLMLSTNGPSNTATLFNRDTGVVTADIATGDDPDGAYHDPASGLAFVMNGGSGDVSVIDIASARKRATIVIGGTPEGAVGDGKGRLFVNVEDANQIAVIDIATRRIVARYPLPSCEEPTGIAYDPASDTLISACRNAVAKLIDAATGKDRGTLPIGARADGSLFDPASRTGFIPALDGTLTVYRLDAGGAAKVTETVGTRKGARTAAYDSVRGRLYLPFATVERDAAGNYLGASKQFGIVSVSARSRE
jgi:YVTN family beta-propeller protein